MHILNICKGLAAVFAAFIVAELIFCLLSVWVGVFFAGLVAGAFAIVLTPRVLKCFERTSL